VWLNKNIVGKQCGGMGGLKLYKGPKKSGGQDILS
jgi:hypothetical protein